METIQWCNRWHRKWLKIVLTFDIIEESAKYQRCIGNLITVERIKQKLIKEIYETRND